MAIVSFRAQHWSDDAGNPSGGQSHGTGFVVNWQNGPLVENGVRKEPNGAFVETIIAAAIDRIEHYQESRFRCEENALALEHLRLALEMLDSRTKNRKERGVEGTHAV